MEIDREKLLEENLGLARKIAWEQARFGGRYEDLLSLALEGLWRAVLAWEPEKGALSTFAYPAMRNNIERHMRHDHAIKRDHRGDLSLEQATPYDTRDWLKKLSAREPGPEEMLARAETRREVLEALDRLDEEERQVLRLRFGLDSGQEMGWKEIGELYGYSRQAAQQKGARAMERLKRLLRRQVMA